MNPVYGQRNSEWAVWVTTLLLCVGVAFPAWAYGGCEGWAVAGLTGLMLLTSFCGTLAVVLRSTTDRVPAWDWRWGLPLMGVMVLLGLQALNPSHIYSPLDQGLSARAHITWLPCTASTPATANALALLLACGAVFWVTRTVVSMRGLYVFIGTVIAGASGMAGLALFQGSDRAWGELVGRFLNENSFAAYANLVLPVALGAARAIQQRANRLGSLSHPGPLLYFCAGVLAASVFLSGSRAGAVVCGLILLVWVLREWMELRFREAGPECDWWHLVLPVLPVVGLLALLGVEILASEASAIEGRAGLQVAARFSAARGAWRMFLDAPVFGMGAGTFHATFPYYQEEGLRGFYRHAHNDWLQWLAELGLVGCGLGAVAVAAALRRPRMRAKLATLSPFIVRGMALGLAGTALHAVIDFPFRIPAVAVLAAAWVGAMARRPPSPKANAG